MTMQIRRSVTPGATVPTLAEGQLAVELAETPPRLWCGVPLSIDASGRVQLNAPPVGAPFLPLAGGILSGAANIPLLQITPNIPNAALSATGPVSINRAQQFADFNTPALSIFDGGFAPVATLASGSGGTILRLIGGAASPPYGATIQYFSLATDTVPRATIAFNTNATPGNIISFGVSSTLVAMNLMDTGAVRIGPVPVTPTTTAVGTVNVSTGYFINGVNIDTALFSPINLPTYNNLLPQPGDFWFDGTNFNLSNPNALQVTQLNIMFGTNSLCTIMSDPNGVQFQGNFWGTMNRQMYVTGSNVLIHNLGIETKQNFATFPNPAPVAGDLWFDGTNLNFHNGSTIVVLA